MLILKNIVKNYETGNQTVKALKNVNLNFRQNEFVSILGPSGCGKTTLLNIIGGLDRYTSGDMYINNVSTKEYKDRDWDTYRNYKIGFVFQSYNLIPHQSVLANVELALTLSGVSKSQRRKRAKEALEKVGLGDCINKKPNQMSGGQMQRVAIARALVNNPDILLADEPTGALDSATSNQVMEILKEISKDKLIIMVTHNPEIAQKYSTRIIKLKDGEIISDSNPFEYELQAVKKEKSKEKHTSMSFLTAFNLSMKNLLTKKGRTILTSFAGSIGIIGIALILSLSNGIQTYIDKLQEDTLSSYPITIEDQTMDMSSMVEIFSGNEKSKEQKDLTKIYSRDITYDMMNAMTSTQTNNLTDFKKFIETDEEIKKYVSAIQYGYGQELNIYADSDTVEQLNPPTVYDRMFGENSSVASMGESFQNLEVWKEMLPQDDGTGINELIKQQYDIVEGKWPEKYNEVVLVVDENNTLNDIYTFCIGLKDADEIDDIMKAVANGEKVESSNSSWDIKDIIGKTYKLVLPTDKYQYDTISGTYIDKSDNESYMQIVIDKAETIEICGIIKPNPDSNAASLQCAVAYTKALSDHYAEQINNSQIVKTQLEDENTDVITGLKFDDGSFDELNDSQKAEKIKDFYQNAAVYVKANAYKQIMSKPTDEYLKENTDVYMSQYPDRQSMENAITAMYVENAGMSEDKIKEYLEQMSDDELYENMYAGIEEMISTQYEESMSEQLSLMSAEQLSTAFDNLISSYSDEQITLTLSEQYLNDCYAPTTYKENMQAFGYSKPETPTSINLYAASFEDKEEIADRISYYNTQVKNDEDKINYTDYVGLMMSSVTTMINAVSYGLIAFVAISLIVSSIMIGIITYISVLERTKEIGILRAIGASKKDISRVFNAETLIIGLVSGLLGVIITVLLCLPINSLLHSLTGIMTINAALPLVAGIILVLISMTLTLIAGIIPAKLAAKKDPVVALRTE
ncbi:MAG: ABC transporter ATP-binding protein/permease [Acutalibacteraceae bacterium]|nr:ABC transporter ATP-binding protein/permease [Acutalibacteraceae bacterium]